MWRGTSTEMTAVVQKMDELLEIDPADKRHFFYEEMKRLFYAMRQIEPEDVDDAGLEAFCVPRTSFLTCFTASN